ncbi:hypothetical protein TVAG_264690 [Trichomonas vaginalis G3]|uniref:Protein phosphatase 1 regulatory subunit 21 N-terminal domain-containing protein n=1 Tax=Trichomonas vaginalis (strain ATCC PRA-98 / G3) TaxID=412133 RepID=A2F9J1_TRIV3|nr:hypothetical protein TVAGG3_0276720 [Trichomonas vaginalis G3]EAX98420.1 hypothetical protein TVAG_264690 [Trichomonas vaginalis G3]KAI5526266.1 hypothetical protein TVAGG3_0276720 [Trichomonas vaginalis G3]|eukprot:XP_001311350.1 hypothetical protein [Trichomonas vaginalis G3]
MGDHNEEEMFPSLDDDGLLDIQEVDPLIMNPMLLSSKKFDNDKPPDLIKLAGDSEELRDIAIKMKKLFETEGFVKYSRENRADLEFVIRTFAYQVSKLAQQSIAPIASVASAPANKGKDANQKEKAQISQEDFQKLTRELLKVQQEAADLDARYKISERTKEALRNELKQTREENNAMAQKVAELNHSLSKERASYDNIIQNLKKDLSTAQDAEREAKDKQSMAEFNVTRLERQIDDLNQELANEKSNNVVTRAKIDARSIKVANYKEQLQAQSSELHHLEAENEDLKMQNGELMNKIESMSNELEELKPENLAAQKSENERVAKALAQITSLCQSQADEINQLYKFRTKTLDLVHKQNEYIGTLTNELTETQIALEQSNDASQTYETPVKSRDITLEEQPSYKTQTIIERDTLEPIRELLRDQYGDLDNAGVQQVVEDLLNSKEKQKETNYTPELLNIIENQLRFINNLARSGKMQLFLLSSPKANETLIESQSFRQDVAVEVARCRQFLSEHDLMPESDLPPPDMAEKDFEKISNSENKRKDFDVASFSALSSELIRRLSESLIDQNNELVTRIKSASEIINFEGTPLESLDSIINQLKSTRVFTKNCKDVLEEEFDYNNLDDSFSKIFPFVKQMSGIRTSLENDLRTVINFDGPIEEVPLRSSQLIQQIQNEFDSLEVSTVNDMKNQLQAVHEQLENEKETSTNVINNLEMNLQQKQNELKEAEERFANIQKELKENQDTLADTKQNLQSTENKLTLLQGTYDDLENEMKRVREENESLQKETQDRQQKYDQRVSQLINQEKEQHDQDVKSLTEKFNEKIDKVQKQLDTKSAKLAEAKSTLKQLINEYDVAFRKQKETTAALRTQNQALMQRINEGSIGSKSKGKTTTKEEALTSEVKGLQAERQILLGRIDQLSARVDQAQKARDSYWQSQLEIKENEISQTKKDLEEVAKEAHQNYLAKLSAVLEQFAPADFDGNDQQILDLIQSLADKLENAESQIIALKRKVNSPKKEENPSEQVSKAVAAIKSVDEWEKWCKSLIQNVAHEIPPTDANKMRKKVSDLCIAGSANKSAEIISSLRLQKEIFVKGAANAKPTVFYGCKGLFLATWFAVKMSRNSGQTSTIAAPNSRSFVSFV